MSVIYEPQGRAREYAHLALNLYGSVGPDGKEYPAGCVHGCTYCYVPDFMHIPRKIFHGDVRPRRDILNRLRKDAPKFAGTDKRVLLCFACDPYQPLAPERDVTRAAIEILREFDIPFQVLTKGGLRAARDFNLYGPNDAFATTLTLLEERFSLKREPKARLPDNRLLAIIEAAQRGITTWVSLEPVIEPADSLRWIELTVPYIDHFKIGKLNHRKSETDWWAFGISAIELCLKYGVPYYIKADLAKYLDGIEFHNRDTRCVMRSNR